MRYYTISMLRIFDSQKLSENIPEAEKKLIETNNKLLDDIISVKYENEVYKLTSNPEYFYYAQVKKLETVKIYLDNKNHDKVVNELFLKVKREILNPMETALIYQEIFEISKIKQSLLASKIMKTQGAISNKLRLLKLPQFVQYEIIRGNLTERHGRALLQLMAKSDFEILASELVKKTISNSWKVAELEKEIDIILEKPINEEFRINLQQLENKRCIKNPWEIIAINHLETSIGNAVEEISKNYSSFDIEQIAGVTQGDYVFVIRIKDVNKTVEIVKEINE
ncbi:MAG: ParB/RepB/Spo0J family partition protein [Mycoplasmatales bacterium]